MKQEKVKQSWSPFWRIIRHNTPWIWMILAVLAGSYIIYFNVKIPEMSAQIMAGEIFDMALIWKYIGLSLLNTLLGCAAVYLQSWTIYRMDYNIQNSLWKNLIGLPMAVYNRVTPTSLISRVTMDTTTISSTVYYTLALVVEISAVVNQIYAVYAIHRDIAVAILMTVPYILFVMIVPGRIYFKASRKKQEALSRFTGYVAERLMNLRLIKATASEEKETVLSDDVLLENYRTTVRIGLLEAATAPFIAAIQSVMTAAGLLVTARLLANGEVEPDAIIFVYMEVMMLFFSCSNFFTAFHDLKRAQGSASAVGELLDTSPEQIRRERTFTMDDADIVFDNVSFRYGDKDVLSNVSFTIPHGKTTAIVGPSGAGKTTILSLLERLYTPTGGTIRFGNTPVEEIHLDDWRRAMGYIQQESPLVTGTVRANIAYGLDSEPTQAGVEEAAALANADGFIRTLPEGYDSETGQMGGKLSGGERQRIALARMIITKPNYLLLDEATASLDAENSAAVQKALRQISIGRTSVIVAHDINTVRHADNIIVLDKGRVQAVGTHEQVYQQSGLYQRYCDLLAKNLEEI